MNRSSKQTLLIGGALLFLIGLLSGVAIHRWLWHVGRVVLRTLAVPGCGMTDPLRYSILLTVLVFGTGCSPAAPTTLSDEAPTGLARAALDNTAFRWDSTATPALTFYYQPGSYGADHAPELRARAEGALTRALTMLDEPEFPHRLRLFYVGSRDEMAALTGRGATGITDAGSHTVVLVANEEWAPFERHEVMHAVSLVLWRDPGAPSTEAEWLRGGWLREGLAAAAEDRCGSATNRGVAAAMQEEGAGLPLDTLTTAFYRQDDLAAYLQAGSLVEYLIGTYGHASFRRLWDEGVGAVGVIYGKPPAELEAEWKAWLDAAPTGERPGDLSVLRERGCG